jgi:hypothetical protein
MGVAMATGGWTVRTGAPGPWRSIQGRWPQADSNTAAAPGGSQRPQRGGRLPTMVDNKACGRRCRAGPLFKENANMWLIVLEALAAVSILVFVMWWTMFSGRRGGELDVGAEAPEDQPPKP